MKRLLSLGMARAPFVLVGGLAACATADVHRPGDEGVPVAVTAATVHHEPFAVLYRASGTIRGRNTAVLASKTTGYVRAVHVRSGDRVTSGQSLVQLEANDARATVARAKAGLDQSAEAKAEADHALEAARAAAKIAKTSYERTATLLQRAAIPQQAYDDAEARWLAASAQERMAQARVRSVGSGIEEAKAALGETRAMLGYADIVAPFTGRVLERHVDPGALATPGTPLLVVTDEGVQRVEAAVEASRAGDVQLGDDVDVELDGPAHPLRGRVGEVVPSVDVASRAFLVKIDLPAGDEALRPGTFARVAFRMGSRPRLVVPTTAISPFGALDRVFVIDGNRVHLRMIARGETQGPWTEILSGLWPDERIVAAPPAGLRDGAGVEVHP